MLVRQFVIFTLCLAIIPCTPKFSSLFLSNSSDQVHNGKSIRQVHGKAHLELLFEEFIETDDSFHVFPPAKITEEYSSFTSIQTTFDSFFVQQKPKKRVHCLRGPPVQVS